MGLYLFCIAFIFGVIQLRDDEGPRRNWRGIRAEFRRSQTRIGLTSFGAVHLALHPCSKLRVFRRRRMKYLKIIC
jgi:hypothetical protein